MKKTVLALTSALLLLGAATLTQAQSFVGLSAAGTSLDFYATISSSPMTVPITGLGGDSLIGIDYFTSGNGSLYGMGTSGTLYSISSSGVATVSTTSTISGPTTIDFNPAANRLRVFAGTSNFRLTPGTGVQSNDGTLAYVSGDPHFGMTPTLSAAAYSNNFNTPPSTTLYSIDTNFNTLVLHPASGSPQFNSLMTVGTLMLGINMFDAIAGQTGFDIYTVGGVNTAFLSNSTSLYTVDLTTGALTSVGTFSGGALRDIAAVPEPSTYALLGLGVMAAGAIAFRRRRQQMA